MYVKIKTGTSRNEMLRKYLIMSMFITSLIYYVTINSVFVHKQNIIVKTCIRVVIAEGLQSGVRGDEGSGD